MDPLTNNATDFPVYERIKRTGGFPAHGCHRGGASTFGPENTLYNFRRCVWECRTQIIEIDLQVTKDDQLILLHDDTLTRTTNGRGAVRNFTLEEIKKFDAAKNYPELAGQNIQVPTFNEFLDEFLQVEDLVFFLDFKDEDSALKTINVVKERGIEDRIILGAVPTETNALLQLLKSPIVPLVSDSSASIHFVMSHLGGNTAIEVSHNIIGFFFSPATMMFFSAELVAAAHKSGCKFIVVGDVLDNEAFQKQCIDCGVDIILSDRPDILSRTMKRLVL